MNGAPGAGAGGVKGAPGVGAGGGGVKGAPGAGAGIDEGPPAPTACGGGVSPGNGGTGLPDPEEGADEGDEGDEEDEGSAPFPELSDPEPDPELEPSEAFCVYQAGGA